MLKKLISEYLSSHRLVEHLLKAPIDDRLTGWKKQYAEEVEKETALRNKLNESQKSDIAELLRQAS